MTGHRFPYVGEGADGARRSAEIDRSEADGLDLSDDRRDYVLASADRWVQQADEIDARAAQETSRDGRGSPLPPPEPAAARSRADAPADAGDVNVALTVEDQGGCPWPRPLTRSQQVAWEATIAGAVEALACALSLAAGEFNRGLRVLVAHINRRVNRG